MKIYSVNDKEFKQFGRVINLDAGELIKEAEKIEFPLEGSKYIASVKEFEKLPIKKEITEKYFGGLCSQMGYCFGHNDTMNALEWHTCSEINIGITDVLLILGDIRDIEEGYKYDSDKTMTFLLKKGEAIEVYATTLHYCPIETSKSGFGCFVGLLKDTNTPLNANGSDKLLFQKNKWIIAHNDNTELIEKGVLPGIYGPNHKIIAE